MVLTLLKMSQKVTAAFTVYFLLLSTFSSSASGAVMPASQVMQTNLSPQERCDRLANHPGDQAKVGAGVALRNIQVGEALSPCQEALRLTPSPHYHFLYGRVLQAAQRVPEAVQQFELAAAGGYAAAMQNLGDIYWRGLGVTRNYPEGLMWFRKAVDAGSVVAMVNLGFMYQNAIGVPQSDDEAVTWFEKAADAGNAAAMYNLGNLYEKKQDLAGLGQAVAWYRKAAVAGQPDAMQSLGRLYAHGQGVPKDVVEAAEWFGKAADAGNLLAMNDLGYMYEYGISVSQNYSDSVKLYRKAAEAGDAQGLYNLGYMYEHGFGVTKSESDAAIWYRKAADAGSAAGINGLAYLYASGRGVPQSYDNAVTLYRRAVDKNYDAAEISLGALYQNGWGVDQDLDAATALYAKAAKSPDQYISAAAVRLGNQLKAYKESAARRAASNISATGKQPDDTTGNLLKVVAVGFVALGLLGLVSSRGQGVTNATQFEPVPKEHDALTDDICWFHAAGFVSDGVAAVPGCPPH